MDFLDKDYILKIIDSDTLDVLTEGDDINMDDAELDGIQEMISYLNVRYNVAEIFEGTTKSPLIKSFLRDIIVYHMHAKVSPDNIPTLRVDRYNTVKNELEKMADGFTNPILPHKDEADKTPIRYGSSSEKTNHYF